MPSFLQRKIQTCGRPLSKLSSLSNYSHSQPTPTQARYLAGTRSNLPLFRTANVVLNPNLASFYTFRTTTSFPYTTTLSSYTTMPYPQYCTVNTQSAPNFHSESHFSSFQVPHGSAPVGGVERPNSSGSGCSIYSTRHSRGYASGFRTFFAGVKKLFSGSNTKASQPFISRPYNFQHVASPEYLSPPAVPQPDYCESVRSNRSSIESNSSSTKRKKLQKLNRSSGAGYVLASEKKNMHPGDRVQLDEMRGGLKAQPSMRSRRSRSSLNRKRSAEAAEEDFAHPFFDVAGPRPSSAGEEAPQTLRRSPSFSEGDDTPFLAPVRPSLAVREADTARPASARMSWSPYSRPGWNMFVTNPDDAAIVFNVADHLDTASDPDFKVTDVADVMSDAVDDVESKNKRSSLLFITNPSDAASVHSNTTEPDDDADTIVNEVAIEVAEALTRVSEYLDAAFNSTFDVADVADLAGFGDRMPESYQAFKARCVAERVSGSHGSVHLPYIAPLAPLDITLVPAPLSPALPLEAVTQNRDEALASLEGWGSVPIQASDIPAALKPQPHPTSLMPGQAYRDAEGNLRADRTSFQAPATRPESQFYGPDDFNSLNPRASYLWPPLSDSWKGKGKAADYSPLERPQAQTPEPLATNEQHRQFYARVESGVFDEPSCNVADPDHRFSTFLDSSSSRPGLRRSTRQRAKLQKPNPAHKSAPAPAASMPRKPIPNSGSVPAIYQMNDNGYPKADLRGAESRFSAAPAYQSRTVDSVEAKFQREAKMSKKEIKAQEKGVKKAEKERTKVEKKVVKEQKRLGLAQSQSQKQVERALGQLLPY